MDEGAVLEHEGALLSQTAEIKNQRAFASSTFPSRRLLRIRARIIAPQLRRFGSTSWHAPSADTTPEHSAKHAVVYVTPSSPHTGLHPNAGAPPASSRPQAATQPETQFSSGLRSRSHRPGRAGSGGVSASARVRDDAHRAQHAFAYVIVPPTHTGSHSSAWHATRHAKRSCSSVRGAGARGGEGSPDAAARSASATTTSASERMLAAWSTRRGRMVSRVM